MYECSARHGYCDTCHHIRAVHGVTTDPRLGPCHCCDPTGDTMTDPMALEWHANSDHGKDGTPYGAPLCNCDRIATRARHLGWVAPVPDVTFDNPITVNGDPR